MKIWFSFKIDVGGDARKFWKISLGRRRGGCVYFLSAAGGLETFKIFAASAVMAVFFLKKSAAAAAAQLIGLHL